MDLSKKRKETEKRFYGKSNYKKKFLNIEDYASKRTRNFLKKIGKNFNDSSLFDLLKQEELDYDFSFNLRTFIELNFNIEYDEDMIMFKAGDFYIVISEKFSITKSSIKRYSISDLNLDDELIDLSNWKGSYYYAYIEGSREKLLIFEKFSFMATIVYSIYKETIEDIYGDSKFESFIKWQNELVMLYDYSSSTFVSKTARAFETKKNISEKNLEIMNSTLLKSVFNFVEIDNDVDLEKYKTFESEILSLPNDLVLKISFKYDLRLRKLGRHNASGIFFPEQNCIGVDVRCTTSFIHELGHSIDFFYGNTFSNKKDFISIAEDIRYKYREHKVIDYKYLASSTEIFARSFEYWFLKRLNSDNIFNNISKTIEKMENNEGYCFLEDKDILNRIIAYFDSFMYTFTGFTLEKENKTIKTVAEKTLPKCVGKKIEDIDFSNSIQLSFFND